MTRIRALNWVQATALGCACLIAGTLAAATSAQAQTPTPGTPRYTVSILSDAISLDTQGPLPLWNEVPWLDSQDRVLGMRKQANPLGAFFGGLAGFGNGMATLARPGAWAPMAPAPTGATPVGAAPTSVKPTNLPGTGTNSELLAISPDGQWWIVYERGLTPAFKVIHGSVSVRVQPGSGNRVFLSTINNQGLAGGYLEQTSTGVQTPVLWQQGRFTRLSTGGQPGGRVYSVNQAGDAAGAVLRANGQGSQATRWIGGQLQWLSDSQAAFSRGEHLNDRGSVTVRYGAPGDANNAWRLGLWRQDQLTELNGLRTLAALNNQDEVLGQSTEGDARAALWRDGQLIDLTRELQAQGVLPTTARAYLGHSVNDRGSVVLDVVDGNQYIKVRAAGRRP